MTEKPKLLPCPFCGGPVQLEHTRNSRDWWGVVCRNTMNLGGTCAIQQIPSASKEAAAERWNRRATHPVLIPVQSMVMEALQNVRELLSAVDGMSLNNIRNMAAEELERVDAAIAVIKAGGKRQA